MKQRLTISTAARSAKSLFKQRLLNPLLMLAVLLTGGQAAFGFAFLGPFETYQIPAIGYAWDTYFGGFTPGGVVGYSGYAGPHNLGEDFRRNVPVLYYAMDANFLNYFGSNGVVAVDQAFGIMNSLTNISQYSPDLSEFPLSSQRINPVAQNLALTDVKSMTLHLMVQQLGIAPPDQYTWTLKDRTMGTPCPLAGEYLVIQRNFAVSPTDLQTPQYSAYVNGTLFTYGIFEACTGPLLAYTVPYAVDPHADTFTSVAAEPAWIGSGFGTGTGLGINSGGVGLRIGGYYTYLTRDDLAGLRYLIQTNNYITESSGPETVQLVTNNPPQFLTTLDYGALLSASVTNTAAQLQALFPGLVVTDNDQLANPPYGPLVTTNYTALLTNYPWAPPGIQNLLIITNYTTNFVFLYRHSFGNVYPYKTNASSFFSLVTTKLTPSPYGPPGLTLTTTTTAKNFTSPKVPSGDYILLPSNSCAPPVILAELQTIVTATTNPIVTPTFTNLLGAITNLSNLVNGNGSTVSQGLVSYVTNHLLFVRPVTCPPDTVGLRQGIEQIHFVRRDFDSLIGTFWAPATNTYTLVELTNNTLYPSQFRRVVRQPDFLFTARDLAAGPQVNPFPPVDTVLRSAMVFSRAGTNGLAGPGTIQSPMTFTFNKVGTINYNFSAATLSGFFNSDQSSAIQGLLWGSFDGTTNDPVVYPNGTSIANLINQVLISVYPQTPVLPDGNGGVPYSFVYTNAATGVVYTNALSVVGGNAPYTWTFSPASPGGLPPSLSLTSDGQITGTPDAVAASTTYDFILRVTDATSRFVDVQYSITIDP